jgi:hypothetical protein
MASKTWGEVKTEILEELDAQDDQIVTDQQISNWYNKAIKIAESYINSLAEDYFLNYEALEIVSDTAEYDLPSDIYADKIRKIVEVRNSDEVYEVTQLEDPVELERFKNESVSSRYDVYKYSIFNRTGDTKLTIYPTPNFTSNTRIIVYYIRDAATINPSGLDSQEIDIPEFADFCTQFCIVKFHEKEKQWQSLQVAKAELEELKQLMIKSLAKRVDDENDEIRGDFKFFFDCQ